MDQDTAVAPTDGEISSKSSAATVVRDPISENYRSIVDVINRTSTGFREGKKWKCAADNYSSSSSSKQQQQNRRRRKRQQMMTHSRTVDERHLTGCGGGGDDAEDISSAAKGRRLLVRQKATTKDDSDEPLLTTTEVVDERPVNKKGMPVRQWTVDCTGVRQQQQQSSSTAYLLRPVSRTSILSAQAAAAAIEADSGDPLIQSRPWTPRLTKSPIGCSFNHSMDSGGRVRLHEKAHPHNRRHHLIKQRTTESAPSQQQQPQQSQPFGGSSRCLPRQHSNASATYSAVLPSSYSHQGITLVRGASCSLVDIPTYLGPSVVAGGGVELAQLCELGPSKCSSNSKADTVDDLLQRKQQQQRPRLQLDLTKNKGGDSGASAAAAATAAAAAAVKNRSARKTQWTVLCVSLTLLTLSVTLVGTMLSVGSQYQEMVIAKQWETFTKNQSRSKVTTEEPFVIVPDDVNKVTAVAAGNSSTNDPGGPSASLPDLPPVSTSQSDTRS